MVGPSQKTTGKFASTVSHTGAPEGPTGCIRCAGCGQLIDVDRTRTKCPGGHTESPSR